MKTLIILLLLILSSCSHTGDNPENDSLDKWSFQQEALWEDDTLPKGIKIPKDNGPNI